MSKNRTVYFYNKNNNNYPSTYKLLNSKMLKYKDSICVMTTINSVYPR
jgi:hypothetical protein